MIRAFVLISLLLIANLFLSSCVTQQQSELKRIRSDLITANQELDQINEEIKQVKMAKEITAKKEMALLSSMNQDKLAIV